MPARTNGSATTMATPMKRFELPALDFKFTSLTEGTNIPPPPPSPTLEKLAPAPVPTAAPVPKVQVPKEKAAVEEPLASTSDNSSKSTGAQASKKEGGSTSSASPAQLPMFSRSNTHGSHSRRAEDTPASPTPSTHPGSIRRLFSRNLLNTTYANGGDHQGHPRNSSNLDLHSGGLWPDNRSNSSFVDDRKAKRSSGWFRRLRGGGFNNSVDGIASKRASILVEEPKKSARPPPPMIPELGQLKAKVEIDDGGSLGIDLFKNIK